MRPLAAFVISLILLFSSAVAHEEQSRPAIGFIYLPDFDKKNRPMFRSMPGDIDRTLIPRGVPLFRSTGKSVPITVFEYVQLKATYFDEKRQLMAYVFDQKPGRYQLGTDEGQYLWVREIDTSGYISFEDMLIDKCFILDITTSGIEIAINPKVKPISIRTWSEVINQHVFNVVELQNIDNVLWARIAPKWHEEWNRRANKNKNDKIFESSRWTTAHTIDGLAAFSVSEKICE